MSEWKKIDILQIEMNNKWTDIFEDSSIISVILKATNEFELEGFYTSEILKYLLSKSFEIGENNIVKFNINGITLKAYVGVHQFESLCDSYTFEDEEGNEVTVLPQPQTIKVLMKFKKEE